MRERIEPGEHDAVRARERVVAEHRGNRYGEAERGHDECFTDGAGDGVDRGLTSGTDLENEMRCAASIKKVLGDKYGTPAQTALRFVLGNRDITARVAGVSAISQLEDAIEAIALGPLPSPAIAKLNDLWANDFRHN